MAAALPPNPEADRITKRAGLGILFAAAATGASFAAPLLPAHLETAAKVTALVGGFVGAGLLFSVVERAFDVCRRETATFFNRPSTISDTLSATTVTALTAGGTAFLGLAAPWVFGAATTAGIIYNCFNLASAPYPHRGPVAPNQANPGGRLYGAALAAHGLAAPQPVAPAGAPDGRSIPLIDDGNPFNVTFQGQTARFHTVRDAYDTLKAAYINTPMWSQPFIDARGTQTPFPIYLMKCILEGKFNPAFAAGSDTGSFWRFAGIPDITKQGFQWRVPADAETLINGTDIFQQDGVNMPQLLRTTRDALKPLYEQKLMEALFGRQYVEQLERQRAAQQQGGGGQGGHGGNGQQRRTTRRAH